MLVRVRHVLAAAVATIALAGCSGTSATWHPAGSAGASQPQSSQKPSQNAASPNAGSPRPGTRTITILGAGDELLHPEVWAQGRKDAQAAGKKGYYFDPIFAGVKPAISAAGLAICHMETPLGPAGGPFEGYPRFSVPPQIAVTIHDIGYDTCSTASNHTLDQGTAGIKRTLDALDAAGVKHTGSYRTQADSIVPNIIEVTPPEGGTPVKIAQLSYTFGFNGLKRPQPWVANQTGATAILAAAHRARQFGAEIVVLSIHWGVEYDHTPNGDQTALAAKLLASPDLDLILGCHEHVVQPISKAAGKWVAYGMGNQLARHAQPENANREGIMPEFTFTETAPAHWKVTTAAVVPTWVSLNPAIRVIDLPAALADKSLPAATRKIYQAALDRIVGYVDSRGNQVAVTSGIRS